MHKSAEFEALNDHYNVLSQIHLSQLFAEDLFRFERFSLEAASLFLDYSKNRITEKTLEQLVAFAQRQNLPAQIEALFCGKPINNTEKRPALHTALRDPSHQPLCVDEINIRPLIAQTLETMAQWVEKLHSGQWLGYSQKPITDIVHIGIGGSHLGPVMFTEALAPYHQSPLGCHFVASVDPAELCTVLQKLKPENTLFILASKTFTTQETLIIADRAKAWVLASAGSQDISPHFLATTAHTKNALDYGIEPEHILPLWDWVGGRYSVWSAIGLPVALCIGMAQFKALLAGAHLMDQHFYAAPLKANMPVILGLLGFWYIQFFNARAHAVLPYDYHLRSLPRYLQQLDMESNGKCVQKNGEPVKGPTAPVLFGEVGTNGQHSFYQLLFQGTHLIPCDFIATLSTPSTAAKESRSVLLAHCLAQSRGLMLGKSASDIPGESELAAHKAISGNQPSNTILIPQLTPHALGALIALYEHKTFVQGVLWNINSFDQWGVELGKDIAKELLRDLLRQKLQGKYDGSTVGLMGRIGGDL